jgi:uncharacterized repeat protein (TIGR03803 family)
MGAIAIDAMQHEEGAHMNTKRRGEGGFRKSRLGALLGAVLVAVTGFSSTAATQELTTLYSFTGSGSGDGANPESSLITDPAGNLYGTTLNGGANGQGTVFQLDPSGNLPLLYSFTGGDGSHPGAGLIADAAGNLYGTTLNGGASGQGTVFQLTLSRTLNVLYSFTGGSDGALPFAGLIADAAGNLYGTTIGGDGPGTVFQLTPWGDLNLLQSFTGGDSPWAGLIADAAGNLYGTTEGGDGPGTVFQLTPSGTLNVLYRFSGRDGAVPHGTLIFDAAGNLYGTTHNGGTSGYGTEFQLTTSGTLNVLHSFTGGSDGAYPEAGLIADMAGNLYGTTWGGGAVGQGTVFQLTPSGALNVLHSFTGGSDGGRPGADLIADAAGNLYGTTVLGGAGTSCPGGCGTVFQLAVPASFTGGGARRNMNMKALRQGAPRMGSQ